MVQFVPKVRIAALAAGVTVLATAVGAVTAAASSSDVASGPAASARLTASAGLAEVRSDAIRVPGVARVAPPTTAECEQSQSIACYTPDQVRTAYQLPALYARGITGKGVTIVIEDSFGSPTIKSDLAAFDRQFGYPAPPKFSVIEPIGKVAAFNPHNATMTGWAWETSLDVEYAHALAPGASIVLAETPATGTGSNERQVMETEEYVVNHRLGAVISQSFSGTEAEFSREAQLQPLRAGILDAASHHVTILAASGDAGATTAAANGPGFYTGREVNWQASDPLVTGVGGTRLIASGGSYTSVAWNDTYNVAVDKNWSDTEEPIPHATGGGRSALFARPSYQNGVKSVTGASRGVPDIAMSAACNGAVAVYTSFQPGKVGWSEGCGTSEATPEFAGIVALADQVAGRWLGQLNPTLYKLAAKHAPGLVNVTSGNNTVSFYGGSPAKRYTITGYGARKGYSLVTGVGTINASLFVYELAGKKVLFSPLKLRLGLLGEGGPDQVGQDIRVDVLVGLVELGQGPPAGRVDAVGHVHGGHLAERAQLVGHPGHEVVVDLPDQPLGVRGPLQVGPLVDLGRRDRDVGPAGLLDQLAAGGLVEVLVRLDSAARRGPVPSLRRRVVVAEEQHSPHRVESDHSSRQSHGVLRLIHVTIIQERYAVARA